MPPGLPESAGKAPQSGVIGAWQSPLVPLHKTYGRAGPSSSARLHASFKNLMGPDLLEHILRDFSKSQKGLLRWRRRTRRSRSGAAVLSKTAGAEARSAKA